MTYDVCYFIIIWNISYLKTFIFKLIILKSKYRMIVLSSIELYYSPAITITNTAKQVIRYGTHCWLFSKPTLNIIIWVNVTKIKLIRYEKYPGSTAVDLWKKDEKHDLFKKTIDMIFV